jgi:sulfite oxidase
VKSLIVSPGEGSTPKGRALNIQGVAWAGEAEMVKVEVSLDGGASWQPAQLGSEKARYAWRLWNFRWKPVKGGDYLIAARATDSQGRTQPDAPVWNPSGYLNNAIDQVKILVEA